MPREQGAEPRPNLRKRIANRVGAWMLRRLRKRVEREWREYEQPPEVRPGSFFRGAKRLGRGETHVYRSLVQIHFHPRERPPR